MRALIRAVCISSVLVLAGAAMVACQRQQSEPVEAGGNLSNAEREAELAAEQLAALGDAASPEQRALYEGEFQASGTIASLDSDVPSDSGGEGAWELRLLDDYAQFSRPGLGDDGGIPGERDFRERGMRVVAGAVTITITHEACQASGIELPYTASVIFEGVAYTGCARRGIDEGERPTWASVLGELIPAIDACLARANSRPARVTFASAIDDDRVSVRLREANGSRYECIAATAGGSVSVFETLSDLDRRAGEGDPEFLRGDEQPRAQNCRSVSEVTAPDGGRLGWLIRRSC
jgi:uncharacterized membrane protein